jgi:hypothetical protein
MVFVAVMSMATSCGIDAAEPGAEVVDESVAALTNGSVVAFEAENLTRSASAIGSKVTSEAAASAGKYVEFNGTAGQAGSWIEFVLPNIAAGPYSLSFLYKANSNRGIVQASIDGVDQGSSCNEYRSTPAYQVSCALGDKTLSAGNHNIRFRVTGKSSNSSGYQMVVDKISLTFKGQCTTLADCSASYQACVANQCVCRPKSASNLLLNANFDGSLGGWVVGGGASYNTVDADGCPGSGSASINALTDVVHQCARVTAGNRYYVGLRYDGGLYCYLAFYSGLACEFDTALSGGVDLVDGVGSAGWGSISGFDTAPAGARSARVGCSGAIGTGRRDQLYLNAVSNSY